MLEGVSVGKLGRGKGKSRGGEFSRVLGFGGSSAIRVGVLRSESKVSEGGLGRLGVCFGDVPRQGGGAVN